MPRVKEVKAAIDCLKRNNAIPTIWTFRQNKIELAEEDLRRWKEEPVGWCSIKEDITRKRDVCDQYEVLNSGRICGDIMMDTCYSCIHWEEE